MIRRPNNRIYKAVVLIWLSLSVVSMILAIVNWGQLGRRLTTSTSAVAIVDTADGILKSLLDVETAQRGFTSTFLANMSHEIRTPMNAILGFSESDLITIVFSEPARKKGVKLECKVAEDLPRALLLDRVRLRQILVNLVGNAVKFTDRDHIYTNVSWEQQQNSSSRITLVIEVQDSGMGIPKDKLDAIFKPFVQSGAHHDKEKTGAGLGLAIVQRLNPLMGGTVTVASVIGQGSAFHLRFPDVPVSARLPVSDQADLNGVADFNELPAAKILVMDDNEQNCNLVAGMFIRSHHQLEFGTNGLEAVEKAHTFRPDILLIDIRIPDMDGREALAELRKTPEELQLLPVIAVTASTLLDEQKGLQEKFNGYLRKPFTRRDLFNELALFLPRRDKDATLSPAPKPAAGSSPEPPGAWHCFVAKLRSLEAGEWPGLRDSLAINETRAFAHKLEAMARDIHCEPLSTYAEALAHYADTSAVDALEEEHLGQFPALIERVQRAST